MPAPVTLNVLANDTTPQGTLVLNSEVISTAPSHGTAVPQADGTIIYTPTPGYTGSDSFNYTVADTFGDTSNAARVSLTVTAAVPPVANPVVAPVLSGQTGSIDVLSGVVSGSPLVPSSVTIVGAPADGAVSVNTSTGAISYVPNANFVGTDTFTYTVANQNGDTSNAGTVTVAVGTSISRARGSAHSLVFSNAAGGLETISLSSGTAEIFFSGSGGSVSVSRAGRATVTGTGLDISSITLTGTTRASALSIRGAARAPVTVGGITDASPLGSIVAPNAALSGTVALNSLGSLNVLSISNATMTVGAGLPGRFSLTTGAVTNSSLTSSVPIASLRAASWTGMQITAPSIGNLIVPGAFNPALSLTATGAAPSLVTARIGTLAGGSWTVPGPVRSVSGSARIQASGTELLARWPQRRFDLAV